MQVDCADSVNEAQYIHMVDSSGTTECQLVLLGGNVQSYNSDMWRLFVLALKHGMRRDEAYDVIQSVEHLAWLLSRVAEKILLEIIMFSMNIQCYVSVNKQRELTIC